MRFIPIDENNLNMALEIQLQIFPKESALKEYKDIIMRKQEYQKNYIVYDNDKLVGITGLYTNEPLEETNSIWLGWFGVLKQYRKKGYGIKILKETMEIAKDLSKKYPIKYFRLYTSSKDNPESLFLYDKVMDIKEEYNNEEDFNYNNTCIIYSKALSDQIKIPYWNNRNLNIREMVNSQEFYKECINK